MAGMQLVNKGIKNPCKSLQSFCRGLVQVKLKPKMTQTKYDKANNCDAKGKDFDAAYWISIMQRDIEHPRDIAGK